MDTWKPRLAQGKEPPVTLDEYFDNAVSDVYRDSGISLHLSFIWSLIRAEDRVIELGIGGGDQSTIAILSGGPESLDSYDINAPPSLHVLERLALENGIRFNFHQEDTRAAAPLAHSVLFVDSLHTKLQVEKELALWAPFTQRLIVFHDTVSFGEVGQCDEPNEGINLAIARFLYGNPDWRVRTHREADNGLLVLAKQ